MTRTPTYTRVARSTRLLLGLDASGGPDLYPFVMGAAVVPAGDAKVVAGSHRLVSLDWMRGLVMVLMAVDHASGAVNSGRLITDSATMYEPGAALPADQFLTRWITHLCAPTFVFLAGTSLALSISRRQRSGESAASIDKALFARGLFIAVCEIVPSVFWMDPGNYIFQVLYAIGTSFILMIPLRRLPATVVVGLGALLIVFGEAIISLAGWSDGPPPLIATLLMVGGRLPHVIVAYPTLHWLAIMMLGWGFGIYLLRKPEPTLLAGRLAGFGVLALFVFLLVRWNNGYGNMMLLRHGDSFVQWIHVSKYPPSLAYVGLELGLMALMLSGLSLVATKVRTSASDLLLVLGRTPMFFYLLHIPLLTAIAAALDVKHSLGLLATYAFAAFAVIFLYPFCRRYGRYKSAHPESLVRYV